MRAFRTALAAAVAAVLLTGCAAAGGTVTEGRELLGTGVSITVYNEETPAIARTMSTAFDEMTAVESQVSPYDASSTVSAFNLDPYESHPLPGDAVAIMDRVYALGLADYFSPGLFGVTRLYDFGGAGSVPSAGTLKAAARAAASLVIENGRARFAWSAGPASATPGLDFGGASKGLAIDRAAAKLAAWPALITAGSSTLAIGSKPDGKPWRVGIEDPREVGRVVAMVSSSATLSVSTSGDYQTYFERDGVRYHHILDPATGLPAGGGIRSVTVFGGMSALDADILSTALFVMGREKAMEYARVKGFGIYLVDELGHPYTAQPEPAYGLEIVAEPRD